jgi:hypothetical protein
MAKLFRRLFRIEAGISISQALADHFTDHAIAWVVWLGGGAVTAYLATITKWLEPWGPIGWGVAVFAGAIIAVAIYEAVVWTSSRKFMNRFVTRALKTSTVNPLLNEFNKNRIKLDIFYNPYYVSVRGKRFTECQLWGPSFIAITGSRSAMVGCEFRRVQVVIVKENIPIWGVTNFEDCSFIEGEICDATLLMNRPTYDHICNGTQGFRKQIPVISEDAMFASVNYTAPTTSPPTPQ